MAAAANPFLSAPPKPLGVRLAEGGRESVEAAHAEHADLLLERGVGRFYGPRSRYAKLPPRTQRLWLDLKLPADVSAQSVQATLTEMTCIGWAMRHVGAAYMAAGRRERWVEIEARVRADDLRGTTLARELQKDGWTAVYFAPDVERIAGDSPYARHAQRALSRGRYHGVVIDEYLLGYRSAPERLAPLTAAPFFFGLVKSGGHVFVGVREEVSEMHWASNPHSPRAVERRPLAGPGFARWREGLLMVPPRIWPSR